MRTRTIRACLLCAAVAVFGTGVPVFAQGPAAAGGQPGGDAADVRRLTENEAVRLAAENNLGIQIARFGPQIEDLNVAQARANWAPSFTSTMQQTSTDSPNNSFLSGAQGLKTSDDRFASNVAVQQTLPWGGSYAIGWDGSRATTTNAFSNFSPQLRSSLSLSYAQPLLRGFRIDSIRQQLQVGQKNREIADVQLRQSLASTTRSVRNAYWDLAYAIAFLDVQGQSLELAQESLRNTRARIEIGTTPPIDVVAAEAEVAQREESVIVAEAQIETAQDTLRALIYDPQMPDFWTLRIQPAELPEFRPEIVDVDGAVRNALDRRTDLQQSRKSLEATDVNIRYLRNLTLPDVTANIDYGLTGLGGTQFIRGTGPFGPGTGDPISQSQIGFGSVLSDLFANEFPSWTASLQISYPIGTSPQQANLARVRMQYNQTQTQIRNQQLQVVTQVREYARQAQTNRKRVDTTRASRELAERSLEAEQRKFAAGTSTNFLVFQAQRDLAQARNNELRAILDYQRSKVDLETVQEVPIGAGNAGAATGTTQTTGTGLGITGTNGLTGNGITGTNTGTGLGTTTNGIAR